MLADVAHALAVLAGIAYGIVAISAQTQLQEDLPEEVRGRVFGVLNMLVSVASILPIIVFGYVADLFGTTAVILAIAVAVVVSGVLSIVTRGPLVEAPPVEVRGRRLAGAPVDPVGATLHVAGAEEDDPPAERPA